jgi:hypothetical protein
MAKRARSVDNRVINRIFGHKAGWVFTPADFLDLGSRTAVATALKRHKKAGTIRQLARGVYDYPLHHPKLGVIAPSTDAIATTLAQRDAVRLQPSGAYAANVLGLSEQVPARISFLTDGPSRRLKIGGREIVLRRTTPRNMKTAGRISGTIIQALRWIGQDRMTDKTIAVLKRRLRAPDLAQIQRDIRFAPAWIAAVFRRLASAKSSD